MLRPRTLLSRALRLRCPLCGGRGLFRRWLVRRDRCPTCGLATVRVDAEVGALGLNTMVSATSVCVVVFLATLFAPAGETTAWGMAACVVTAVAVPLAFFPLSHTIWGAYDLWVRPLGYDEVAPGWELAQLRARRAPRDPGRAFHLRVERAVNRAAAAFRTRSPEHPPTP